MNAEHVRALAAEFEQMIRWHLSGDDYAAAVEANRAETNPAICHTRDYIDANVTMEAAFQNVMARPSDVDSADDAALTDAAWTLWKDWTTGRHQARVDTAERAYQAEMRKPMEPPCAS